MHTVIYQTTNGGSSFESGLGLYTILLLPILYVEWQNRGGTGKPYIAPYSLQNTTGGGGGNA